MVEHARRLGLMTCELNRQSFDEIIQLHIGSSLFAKNKFSFTLKECKLTTEKPVSSKYVSYLKCHLKIRRVSRLFGLKIYPYQQSVKPNELSSTVLFTHFRQQKKSTEISSG